MLELDGSIWFRSGAQTWGGKDRIDLLAQIDATGSITNAARAVGMSYKGAWDAIDAMNNLAGEPLVIRAAGGKGGGGTRLTDRARGLIATFRALEAEHRKFMENLTRAGLDTSGDIDLMRRFMLKTSARNKLLGTVILIREGAVNDEIVPADRRRPIHHGHHCPKARRNSTWPWAEAIALVKDLVRHRRRARPRPAPVGAWPAAGQDRGAAPRRGKQRNPDRPGRRHHPRGHRHERKRPGPGPGYRRRRRGDLQGVSVILRGAVGWVQRESS